MRGVLAIALAVSSSALNATPLFKAAASAELECRYDRVCLDGGRCDESEFVFRILRTANGSPTTDSILRLPLQQIEGDQALSFLAVQRNGSIHSTTIFQDGTSVHSSHLYILESSTAQYVGRCEVLE